MANSTPGRRRPKTSRVSLICLALLIFVGYVSAYVGMAEEYPTEKLIGIHLAPGYSSVGAVVDGKIQVLNARDGRDHIFSLVVATDSGLVVDPERKVAGPDLFQAAIDMNNYLNGDTHPPPSTSVNYVVENGRTVIQVALDGINQTFTPEEIYAPLLAELRSIAESHIGGNITGAVVTIPRTFSETDREYIRQAGRLASLPIMRQTHELSSMVISLGLDEESYDSERYVLLYEMGEYADVSIAEVDMGVVDLIAAARKPAVREEADHRDVELPRAFLSFDDTLDALDTIVPIMTDDIYESSVIALDAALDQARLTQEKITDLIFAPGSSLYPDVQKRVAKYFPKARVINSPSIDQSGVWGATLLSGWMQDEGWVPCCCETSHPPLGIGTSDGVVEIVTRCERLPIYRTASFSASCTADKTLIQLYMRDVAPVDYHSMFELGDEYVPDTTVNDVLLGEFDLPTGCSKGRPQTIEISAFINRQGVLKVRALNKVTKDARMLTFENTNFACGNGGRFSPRNYTLAHDREVNLQVEYEIDLKGLLGLGHYQKPVEVDSELW